MIRQQLRRKTSILIILALLFSSLSVGMPVAGAFSHEEEPIDCEITLLSNPPAGGTVAGGGTYPSGGSVTVSATPGSAYSFVNWTESGQEVSSDPSYTFTATNSLILTANFTLSGEWVVGADFTAEPLSGPAPLDVQFTDASTGSISGWTWYFGDEEFLGWVRMTNTAAWSARYNHKSVVQPDGGLVLIGGYDGSVFKTDVWRSTDRGVTWSMMSAEGGWSPREHFSVVALPDGSLVLMGGGDGSSLYNDVWRSTDNGVSWTPVTADAPWSARLGHTSAVLPDGSILLMGGGSFKNDVWRSTDGGATWSEVTASAAWSARNLSNSVVLPDGSIVLIGGRDGDGVKKDVWRSVDGGATWIQMADNAQWSDQSLSNSAVALADGSIILMDNIDGVWRGADGGAAWEQISVVSEEGLPRAYHSSAVLPDGNIVSMGGLHGSRRRDVWHLGTAGSTAQNPVHTYTKPGTYPVTLYAYNEYGFNIEQKAAYISVEGIQYTINVSAFPAEGGTVEGGGTYMYGSEVILTAIPSENYYFVNWTEDGTPVSTDSNYTFAAASDRTLVANFALNQYHVLASAFPAEGGTVTGDGTYAHGSEVALSAIPATGYTFTNWTENGAIVSTEPDYTFTINGDRTFVANFALKEYEISVLADPVNGGNVTGGGIFTHGESVTVQATPAEGYYFTNWSEGGVNVSSNSSYTFTAAQGRILTAHFSLQVYTISVSAAPTGGGSVGGGGTYPQGTSVTVTASPNEGYHFGNWTEGGTVVSSNSSYIFPAAADRNLVANFALNQYHVLVSAFPAEGGTVTGDGTYAHGSEVALSATPATGYTFTNWTENGAIVSTEPDYTFTINGDRTFVANFALKDYEISVLADPVNGGNVTGGGTYTHGDTVTAQATPAEGYYFSNWSEGGVNVSSNSSYTFTADKNRTLTANFSIQVYTINLSPSPPGGGSVGGDGNYPQGASATVTASPNTGYRFVNWTEGGTEVSTASNYTFTVNDNRNLVANFALNTYNIAVSAAPADGGTVAGPGTVGHGAEVTVTATPHTGYYFANWTEGGEIVSIESNYTFAAERNRNLVANFRFTLAKVSAPNLNPEGIAAWTGVSNAASYQVKLYKGGVLHTTQNVLAGVQTYNFYTTMISAGVGTYTVTVQALGTGIYDNGPESDLSNPQSVIKLATVSKPNLSEGGLATWVNVANAGSYKVQLLKNGTTHGQPVTASSGTTGVNFSSAIAAAGQGSYSVTVQAIGSGLYLDGNTSVASNSISISTAPSAITSTTFVVNESKSFVSKVAEETTVTALLAGINERDYVKVYRGATEITGSALVGTGVFLRIMDGSAVVRTYTAVISGDTNGDGKITITDMIATKAHLLGSTALTGAAQHGADANGDGNVSITDFIQIKSHILGIESIVPRAY